MLEAEVEKLVRKHVRRGTILIHIRADRVHSSDGFLLNHAALRSYIDEVKRCCTESGVPEYAPHILSGVLALPGIAGEGGVMGRPPEEEWEAAESAIEQAFKTLNAMRKLEGQAMAEELLQHRSTIATLLGKIHESVPAIMTHYRNRLRERVTQALSENNVRVSDDDLLREVALFAEKSDVAEEVVRLESHLAQFLEIIQTEEEGVGRKLEFVTQEMFREANTIGTKAGDVSVARNAVEIKSTLEKIRELVMNIE